MVCRIGQASRGGLPWRAGRAWICRTRLPAPRRGRASRGAGAARFGQSSDAAGYRCNLHYASMVLPGERHPGPPKAGSRVASGVQYGRSNANLVPAACLPVAAEFGDKMMPTCSRQRARMISTQDSVQPDRSHLVAVARADRSELTPERRSELDELLAGAEPPYDRDPSRWDPAISFAINARVAANAWARAGCWKEAWQVMAGAVPDDPMHATEVAELRLLEILLDTMHRGVEAVAGRLVDDVDPLIRAGQHHARSALFDRTQQLLLMTGRTHESLRLLGRQRIAPLERLTSMTNLLTYARPNVFTLAGRSR